MPLPTAVELRADDDPLTEIAAILAKGIARMRESRTCRNSAPPSLEVGPETVLSVTGGLLPEITKRGEC